MTDENRVYLKAVTEVEWHVYGYSQKIKFIAVLHKMLANNIVLLAEEICIAQNLLTSLQNEMSIFL